MRRAIPAAVGLLVVAAACGGDTSVADYLVEFQAIDDTITAEMFAHYTEIETRRAQLDPDDPSYDMQLVDLVKDEMAGAIVALRHSVELADALVPPDDVAAIHAEARAAAQLWVETAERIHARIIPMTSYAEVEEALASEELAAAVAEVESRLTAACDALQAIAEDLESDAQLSVWSPGGPGGSVRAGFRIKCGAE